LEEALDLSSDRILNDDDDDDDDDDVSVWMGKNHNMLEAFTPSHLKIEDVKSCRFKQPTRRHIPHDLFFINAAVNKRTCDVILLMHFRT